MIRIDGYLIDLALSEEIVFPGEVTKYPAEVGVDFSDHIRDLPAEITLQCIVSDTPIGDVANDQTRQGADLLASQGDLAPLPSADALAFLREMKARRRPVSVETSIGVFDSMACEEITVNIDAAKSPGGKGPGTELRAGALFFTAKFCKFVQVTNKRTKARVRTAMPNGSKLKVTVSDTVQLISSTVLWKHGSPPGSPNITEITRVKVSYSKPAGVDNSGSVSLGLLVPGHPYVIYNALPGNEEIAGQEREELVADLTRDLRAGTANFANVPGGVNFLGGVKKPTNLPLGTSADRLKLPDPPVTNAIGLGDQSAF